MRACVFAVCACTSRVLFFFFCLLVDLSYSGLIVFLICLF